MNIQCFQFACNTRPRYFKVESKITRDFAVQCSLFTYAETACVLLFTETPDSRGKQFLIPNDIGILTLHITAHNEKVNLDLSNTRSTSPGQVHTLDMGENLTLNGNSGTTVSLKK